LVRVRRLLYLGTEFGYMDLSNDDKLHLQACMDTIEDYGLLGSVTLYQHCGLYEAIVDTADLVGASVVFARLPKGAIPFWNECQLELLRWRLSHQHIDLYDEPGVWGQPALQRRVGVAA
jgi:hypothetical protein